MKNERKGRAGARIRWIAAGLLVAVFLAGQGAVSVLSAESAEAFSADGASLLEHADTAEKQTEETAAGKNFTDGWIVILSQGQSPATGDSVPLMGMLFLAFCSLFLGIMEILRKIRF